MANGKKVALVTDSNRGIGFETARQLGQRGVRGYCLISHGARSCRPCEQITQRRHRSRGTCTGCDQGTDRAVAAKFIESRYGKLDILVNNAGVGPADGLIGLRASESIRLSQITPDALDHWKSSWSPKAKNPDDRIGKTTAGRRLEKIKRFLNYCVKMRWLAATRRRN